MTENKDNINKPAIKLAILLHGYTGDLNTFSGKHNQIHSGNYYDINLGSDITLKAGFKSYNRFRDSGIEIDYYIHSWSVQHEKAILQLYKPKAYKIEEQIDFTSDFNPEIHTGTKERYHVTKSRAYSLNESIKQFLNNSEDKDYDFILSGRFDLIFVNRFNLENLDNNKLYIPRWIEGFKEGSREVDPTMKVQDFWFIAPKKSFQIINQELSNSINDYINNTIGRTGPSSHHVLKLLYRKLNIKQEQLLLHYSQNYEVMKGDFALVRDYVHYLGLYN
tara:strand:+ start:84 stop:914 length:831 start_codon:yes stop_codon:yes gene_type:complete